MLHERSVEVLPRLEPPVWVYQPEVHVSPLSLNERQKRRLDCLASVLEGLGYHTTPEELALRLKQKPFDSSILGSSVKDPFALPEPENVLSSSFLDSFRSPTYRTGRELAGRTVENTARVLRHVGMVHADSIFNFYGLSLNDLFSPDLNHPAFTILKEEQREALSNFREHLAGLFSSKETPPDGKMLKEYATSVVELQQVDCWAQGVKEKYPNKNFVGFVPLIEKKTGRLAGIMPEIGEGPPGLRLGTLWWVTDRVSGLCLRSRETAAHPPDPLSSLGNKLIELVDSIVKPPPDRKPTRRRLAPRRLATAVVIGVLGLTSAACAEPTGSPAPPTTPVEDTSATAVVESTAIPPADNIILREKPGEWEPGLKHYLGKDFDVWFYDSHVEVDGVQIWIRVSNPWCWDKNPNPNLAEGEQERLVEQVVQDFKSKLTRLKTTFPGNFHPPSVIVLIPGRIRGWRILGWELPSFCFPPNEKALPRKIPVVLPTSDREVIIDFDLIMPYGSAMFNLPEMARGFAMWTVPPAWCNTPEETTFIDRAEYHELTHIFAFEVEPPNPLKEGVAVYGDWVATVVVPPADDLKIVGMSSEDIYSDNWNISAILTAAKESGKWAEEPKPKQYSLAGLAVAALQAADKRFLPEITAITKEEIEAKGGDFVQASLDRLSRLNLTEEQRQLALWLLGQ